MRIVEASIAVLIIFSALLLLSSNRTAGGGESLADRVESVMNELAQDESIRDSVLSPSPNINTIKQKVEERLGNAFEVEVRICNLEENCPLESFPLDAEVFVDERVFSVNVDSSSFTPKKVRVFVWRKT